MVFSADDRVLIKVLR